MIEADLGGIQSDLVVVLRLIADKVRVYNYEATTE